MKYLIFGGELADGTKSDILVADGEIVSVGLNLDQSGATLIDATGCKVLPGLVD